MVIQESRTLVTVFTVPGPLDQPAAPTSGWIRITTAKKKWLPRSAPIMTVNGYTVSRDYGTVDVPMPVGLHRVEGITSNNGRYYGEAQLDVQITPGSVIPVFYMAPAFIFMKGSIGNTEQPVKGFTAYAVLMIFVAIILLLLLGIGLLALIFSGR